MNWHMLPRIAVVAWVSGTALPAGADTVYKCARGDRVVYQDMPCKPGAYRDNVLTARKAGGTVNYVSLNEPQRGPAAAGTVLEPPRFTDQDLMALEEKQQLLGKPPIREQLAAPTAIETRTQEVWTNVKRWFLGLWR